MKARAINHQFPYNEIVSAVVWKLERGNKMKKVLIGFLAAVFTITTLTGCGMFASANAVILYGEEEEVLAAIDKEKDVFIKEDQFKIKIWETGGKKLLFLTDETAQFLIDKKLLREITDQEKRKTKAVTSLPKVTKGEGLFFAREDAKDFDTKDIDLEVTYEGNIIIGEGRVFTDMFLIIQEDDWSSLQGTEKTMAILEYDKDPSAEGLRYDVDKTQLVRIQD